MFYFKPLDEIDRPTITTTEAAYFLSRTPATLRNWAIRNDGPIKCIRMGGRLAWPVDAIRALVAGAPLPSSQQQLPTRKPGHDLPPLDEIDRPNLTTTEAAYYLNRPPATMRTWVIRGTGPIQCVRIDGGVLWPTDAVRALVAAGQQQSAQP